MEKSSSDSQEPNSKEMLSTVDSAHIRNSWTKALARSKDDPDGAITSARTLIESTCKYILDIHNEKYSRTDDLPKLYKKTITCLDLSPTPESDSIFKEILGSSRSIVSSIGALRNRLGDAHGRGHKIIQVDERHAKLAVELAGAMTTYLIETHEAEIKRKNRNELSEDEVKVLLEKWLEVAEEENISDPGRLPYTDALIAIQRRLFAQTSLFVPEGEIFHFLVNRRKRGILPRPQKDN